MTGGLSHLRASTGSSATSQKRHSPSGKIQVVFDGVEPTLGFEPRTCCLRNSCSTAELCRRRTIRGAPYPTPPIRAPPRPRGRYSPPPCRPAGLLGLTQSGRCPELPTARR